MSGASFPAGFPPPPGGSPGSSPAARPNSLALGSVQCKAILRGHTGSVPSVRFNLDKNTLTAASPGGIQIWDLATGNSLQTVTLSFPPTRSSTTCSVQLSPDGETLVFLFDSTVQLWDVASGSCRHTFPKGVIAVRLNSDGKTCVTTAVNGNSRLWDMESGGVLVLVQGSSIFCPAQLSPDGKTLVSIHKESIATLQLWDVASGTCRHTLRGHEGMIEFAAFSSDGKVLVSTDRTGCIRLWDVASGSCSLDVFVHDLISSSVQMGPDGNTLVFRQRDDTIELWDVNSSSSHRILSTQGHLAQLSPDGKFLACALGNGTLQLWDVASGTCRQTLSGPTSPITSIQFSPNGQTFVSTSQDGTIMWWG